LVVISPVIYSIFIVLSARLAGERHDAVGDRAAMARRPRPSALMMTTGGHLLDRRVDERSPGPPCCDPIRGLGRAGGRQGVLDVHRHPRFYAGAQRIGAAQAA
jgi:hypothetical protein